VEDLELRLIRTIGDPNAKFAEDPVRMLRAIRFSAQLDFRIEHHSWEAMAAASHRITLSSPARLFDEIIKLLLSGVAERCWQLLCESGISAAIFPDFSEWQSRKEVNPSVNAVARIDRDLQSGKPVSTPLLLALFFGDYLMAKGESLLHADNSWQARVDRSLAGFMAEIGGRLFIPQRTIMGLREILLLQQRLLKMPGRKPENVISRPGFADALEYLGFCSVDNALLEKTFGWWERLAEAKGVMPGTERNPAEKQEGRPKGRRRRRGKKKPEPVS
jgi:poly(A) polymerase